VNEGFRHKDGVLMRKLVSFAFIAVMMFTASASSSSDCKIAIHVQPHANPSCNRLPTLDGCLDIEHTYTGCEDVDVFPVVYDISGLTGIEVGITWPDSWGSCAFRPCGFDLLIHGEITNPGDYLAGTWTECQYVNSVVAGYGWLAPTSAGRVCPFSSPTGFMGVTDCGYTKHEASAVFCAGVCGAEGDNPCGGGISEDKTWGSIKSMYR
jgi:hypothetical protein